MGATAITAYAVVFYFFLLFTCLDADLANYRVPGVLQRFAACYFILSMLLLVTNPGTDSVLVNAHIPSLIFFLLSIAWVKSENCPSFLNEQV